jgi:tRNA-dihydrouridine synthase B
MPKIANSGDGCGLMRTPELAGDIVAAVSKAVNVPVTVKCRLGWDKGSINVLDFAKRMEDMALPCLLSMDAPGRSFTPVLQIGT